MLRFVAIEIQVESVVCAELAWSEGKGRCSFAGKPWLFITAERLGGVVVCFRLLVRIWGFALGLCLGDVVCRL